MKNLVIIGKVFPEPNSTAAGSRMIQLMDLFLTQNYQITFLSTATISENSFDLSSKNIQFQNISLNDSSFDELIKNLNPDIVVFDRFTTEEQFGWKVSEQVPNAVKILDTEDLHFLRNAREKAFRQNKFLENSDLINDVFKREIASILRCDLSLIISEFEMNLLIEKFKMDENILFYLPLFGEVKNPETSFSERKNFVSIGNFLHEPNWQTVLQLKKIWKDIKKQLPEAEIHIYGAYASEKVFQLHNEKEGFIIKGRAESVETVFNTAKVLLAPIPFGAGIKGKLLESMQFGLPNVTSAVGAEAMHGNLDWNGFITDDENEFIEKAVLLYQDENLWQKSQENGFNIIENRFKKELFEPNFIHKIQEISENLESYRNQNILGQILQHHTLQSTKYLSKWIEEKNKK
ncbi:glycosyltransferase [Cloacibacterium sp. TD35]|uniref:glycosyltransferase n=1 Tax=Cloacibacterium sp. TD35 TaxID=2976818 RepID=UPI00237D7811|nr:glycosyltransferase family 4 protein [Cloacibacterium sp. TD35]WDT67759.1 glycosyltransferase family 4 protein [Cloacibacterium sp. TD35]